MNLNDAERVNLSVGDASLAVGGWHKTRHEKSEQARPTVFAGLKRDRFVRWAEGKATAVCYRSSILLLDYHSSGLASLSPFDD